MRIPQSQQTVVKNFIQVYKSQTFQSEKITDTMSRPSQQLRIHAYPLFSSKVAAGFPSPADEYMEKRLDPNDFLIDNQDATFFVTIEGHSMIDAGLLPGDKVVVDRSKQPQKNHIVLAVVNGEFTIKRLSISRDGLAVLLPENHLGTYQPIVINEDMQFEIWGVVTGSFRRF
ncbi:Error-prone repair protein UmuD [Methylophaga frappieri]|uniref:Error-prone repair protein UmuD n=2 Tax=Methylophaga frappieri (strain ATCC BAA-2434 / DSM 25690 / JAM7) TaxID=754477 RepID=I1YIW8_METFJ|nr:Error-prone repair protein UmuD [Methylophaga frappieri]